MSENSVPLKPMVLLIIIPFLNGYFIGNIPNIFRQTHLAIYPLVMTRPMGIVDLPMKDGDFPVCELLVCQRLFLRI